MGDGYPVLSASRRIRSERRQSMTAVYAVMAALLFLILLQFLLLTAALNEHLSGHRTAVWGAAAGSGLCFVVSCRLIALLSPGRRVGR